MSTKGNRRPRVPDKTLVSNGPNAELLYSGGISGDVFIGVDPSILEAAMVAIDGKGRYLRGTGISIPSNRGYIERLVEMVSELEDNIAGIVSSYYEPERKFFVTVEEPFAGKSGTTALKTFGVYAALCYRISTHFPGYVQLLSLHPMTLKKFLGVTKKELVIREVYRRWGFDENNHNIVDAFAMAQWALATR